MFLRRVMPVVRVDRQTPCLPLMHSIITITVVIVVISAASACNDWLLAVHVGDLLRGCRVLGPLVVTDAGEARESQRDASVVIHKTDCSDMHG